MSYEIKQLDIKNFGCIGELNLKVQDGVFLVQVVGPNGSGKSTALKGIGMALSYAFVKRAFNIVEPVKKGEESGEIRVKIKSDDDEINIVRIFESGNKSQLIIVDSDGMPVKKPANFIEKLVNNAVFDMGSFINASPREQFKSVLRLVDFEKFIGKTYDELVLDRQEIYDKRTFVNRRIKDFGELGAEPPYAEAVSISNLNNLLSAAHKENARRMALSAEKQNLLEEVDRINEEIERLKRKKDEHLVKADDIATEIDSMGEPVNIDAIQCQLDDAETINNKARVYEVWHNESLQKANLQQESEKLTEDIKKHDESLKDACALADLGIDGLEFDFKEESLLFNGLPLSQEGDGQKLIVAASLAAKSNPDLKDIVIVAGAEMDDDKIRMLGELGKKWLRRFWVARWAKTELPESMIVEMKGD